MIRYAVIKNGEVIGQLTSEQPKSSEASADITLVELADKIVNLGERYPFAPLPSNREANKAQGSSKKIVIAASDYLLLDCRREQPVEGSTLPNWTMLRHCAEAISAEEIYLHSLDLTNEWQGLTQLIDTLTKDKKLTVAWFMPKGSTTQSLERLPQSYRSRFELRLSFTEYNQSVLEALSYAKEQGYTRLSADIKLSESMLQNKCEVQNILDELYGVASPCKIALTFMAKTTPANRELFAEMRSTLRFRSKHYGIFMADSCTPEQNVVNISESGRVHSFCRKRNHTYCHYTEFDWQKHSLIAKKAEELSLGCKSELIELENYIKSLGFMALERGEV